jgi:hypothetical protein
MEIVHKRLGPFAMDRWIAVDSSVHVLNQAGRYAEAESLAREMLPILEANHLPDNDGRRAESFLELGKALRGEKKNREADETLKKSAAIYDVSGMAGVAKRVRALMTDAK